MVEKGVVQKSPKTNRRGCQDGCVFQTPGGCVVQKPPQKATQTQQKQAHHLHLLVKGLGVVFCFLVVAFLWVGGGGKKNHKPIIFICSFETCCLCGVCFCVFLLLCCLGFLNKAQRKTSPSSSSARSKPGSDENYHFKSSHSNASSI